MYLLETALQRKEALLQEKDAEIQKAKSEIQKKNDEILKKNLALKTKDETMVHVLFEAGISVEKIASSTGLSVKEINRMIRTC